MKKWKLFTWGSNDETGKFRPRYSIYIAIGIFLILFLFGLFKDAKADEPTYTVETSIGQSWKSGEWLGDLGRASLLVNDRWQVSLGYVGQQEFSDRETIEDHLYISLDRRVFFRDEAARLQPWLGLGFAVLPNGENWRVTLPISFHLQAGVIYKDCIGPFNCVLQWDHISNGGLADKNPGWDAQLIGLQYQFK